MIELQRKLLGDSLRNQAFYDALKASLKPGMEVLDLGSGTGFLAFLASKLGAKHVTCVEVGDIIKISKQLANRNNVRNCTFLHAHSTELKVAEVPKADILVSETLGNYALEENIIECVEDAKRFLKSTAVIIPGKIWQYVCPITSDRLYQEIDTFNVGFDLRFDEARTVAMQNMFVRTIRPEDLLTGSQAVKLWDTVDFSQKNASVRRATPHWKTDTPCTVYGFALWWKSELVKGVQISTSPMDPATHWEQIYLPVSQPLVLPPDSTLSLHLVSDTRWQVKMDLTWHAKVMDASGKVIAEQEMDMKKGHLN
ncbi:MAG: 50S ribosomal protein L11 methyltransferase [Candidatus Peribacteraceae bacterium]